MVLKVFKKDPIKKLESDPRFAKYNKTSQERLRKITKFIEDNAIPNTLPVSKAIEAAELFKFSPPDKHPNKLTKQQIFLSKLVSDMMNMPYGKELTETASAAKVYLSVTKSERFLGAFVPSSNMICMNLDYIKSDINWHEQGFEHTEKYADGLNTALEEFIHASQLYKWMNFLPSYVQDFRNLDKQLWNLMVEVQAKLIVIRSYLQFYGNQKVSQLHNSILLTSHYKPILEKSLEIYTEHGFKNVDQNAELLLPAFEAFFRDPFALDCYYDQTLNFTSDLHSKEAVPHERYIEAFGKIPGMEGNMLAQKYKNIYDLIFIMPDQSKLAQCFKGYFSS